MTDIDELIKRMARLAEDHDKHEQGGGASNILYESIDALTRLQAENAELRQKCDHIMTEHGKRLEEVVRLREDAERLDGGSILMRERDEFGDEYDVLHRGLDLRKAIDAARQMEAKIPQ